MLSRPDPQSFTKFLVSLGVFLCLAAFLAPALVLRETKVLQVSQKALDALTPTGRNEIERRQRVSRTVGHVIPYAGLLMLVGGIGVLVYATPRLRRQEAADDARAEAELQKLTAELAPQTADDVAERVQEEAEAVVAESTGVTQSEFDALVRDIAHETGSIQSVETGVLNRIREIAPPEYELLDRVKAAGFGSPLLLDGILRAKGRPDIVVDIRVTSGSFRGTQLRNRIDDSIARLIRYRRRADPNALTWLVIVTDGGVPAQIDRRVRDFSGDVRDLLTTSVVDRSELGRLRFPKFDVSGV